MFQHTSETDLYVYLALTILLAFHYPMLAASESTGYYIVTNNYTLNFECIMYFQY